VAAGGRRPVGGRVVDRHGGRRGGRQADGEEGGGGPAVALGEGGGVDREGEVVVLGRAGALGAGDVGVCRGGEGELERLGGLDGCVARDRDGDGAAGRAGGDGERAALGRVVAAGGGRAIGGGVVHGDGAAAGGRQGDLEGGVLGPRVALGDGDV